MGLCRRVLALVTLDLFGNQLTPLRAYKESDTDASIHPEDANSMALLFGVTDSDAKSQSVSQQLTTNWGILGAVAPELPNNIAPFIESFEIKAHFVANQPARALDLIRRSWGWYLNNPLGTQSTCVEGYLADGTFGYRGTSGYNNDASFVSHSHGWSTGPTHALTTYVVGLSITAPSGTSWKFAPQFGDLTHAEGGFTTPLGKFSAGWTLQNGVPNITYNAPSGTKGLILVPAGSQTANVAVDRTMQSGKFDSEMKMMTIEVNGDGIEHTLTVGA